MKCALLAAGYATRLYPLTKNFPKPLLKVKEKTILDWLIDDLETTKEIDEYIVISNHKFANNYEDWKKEKPQRITIIDDGTETNETRLGAVADINLAIKQLNLNDDLIVLAGDNVLDFSLSGFIKFFKEKNASAVMFYEEKDVKTLPKRSCMLLDKTNRITKMVEKPEKPFSNLCCPPFYIYHKNDLHFIEKMVELNENLDSPGAFVSYLCGKADIYAYKMPGSRYDIGTIETYNNINQIYNGIRSKI